MKTADLAKGAVTGSKIAPTAVTGAAVKDNSLTGADIDESSLKLPSTSPYATIPSGTTVTGSWNYYDGGAVPIDLVESLPAPAPVALTDADVSFEANTNGLSNDQSPGCSGEVANPIAPAGKVCIYIDHGQTSPNSIVGKALQLLPSTPASRYGFEIDSTEAGANGQAGGIWAYTAP